jgi:hypothetical protein
MLSEQIPLPSPGRPHLVGLTRPLTHVPKKVVSGCSTGSSLLIFEHRFVILPRKERSGLSLPLGRDRRIRLAELDEGDFPPIVH